MQASQGLQALIRKKDPHIMWAHCMLDGQATAFLNMSDKLQAVFEAVMGFVDCITERKTLNKATWQYGSRTHDTSIILKHAGSVESMCFTGNLCERRNSHFPKWQ
jgi:hypothetical protein